jgi:hypothetical protein
VACWGDNTGGQLGDGTTASRDFAAPVIELPASAVDVAVGGDTNCSILESGEAFCWGFGYRGLLGNGNLPEKQPIPTKVSDLTGIAQLSVYYHACAALEDGLLYCWGSHVSEGGSVDEVPAPVLVDGISRVSEVAAGRWYTCALTWDQEIYCWGANDSHQLGLGEGSPLGTGVPTRVEWRSAVPWPLRSIADE